MEENKQNTPEAPRESEDRLEELLLSPQLEQEIGPDEQAVAAAGLTRPEDLELESIMQEAVSENWGQLDVQEEQQVLTLSDEELLAYDPDQPLQPSPEPEAEGPEEEPAEAVLEEDPDQIDIFAPGFFDQLLYADVDTFKDDEFRDTFGEGEELSQVFEPEVPAPVAPESSEPIADDEERDEADAPVQEAVPVRKRRPRNKKAYGFLGIPHIISTVIWLALVVAIGASLGNFLWICAADVLAFGREDQTVYITVTDSDTLDTVTDKLHAAGLVEYPGIFKLYGQLADIMEDVNPGTYKLNTLYDYHALVNMMSSTAQRVTVEVVIPEGYTCAQIFALLEEKGVCTAEELEDYSLNGTIGDHWFLQGISRDSEYCLEGYLFPDTYEFYLDDTPGRVFTKFFNAFDYRFTDIMKDKLITLNETLSKKMKQNGYDQAYIDSHQMTIREVVIIASMIEKETSGKGDDSYNISSVIYNRLTNANAFPFLNIDATLVYALGKTDLTAEDKLTDTPYNTYTYKGLIPGPIANPGRASLDAALDPLDTKYYYYVLDPSTGTHDYSKTLAEHEAKVEKYQQMQQGQ